jgi:hypothetical protein
VSSGPSEHERRGVSTHSDSSDTAATENAAPRPLVVACVIILAQALALLAAAAVLVVKTIDGSPGSVARALLGAAFAVAGAVLFALCSRGIYRGRPAARTPVVVLEILCIPVAYSLAFQAGRIGYGGPIFVSALAVLYLLFTPPARAVLDRDIRR